MPSRTRFSALRRSCLVLACAGVTQPWPVLAQNPPSALMQPLTRASSRQQFMVTLVPPDVPVVINQMQNWTVRVTQANGKPLEQASFRIEGGMPQHNHGLPTRPQVTQNLGHGSFLLEGMRFNMPGAWELTLFIQSGKLKDSVNFQLMIELPPAPGVPATHASMPMTADGKERK